MSTPAVAATRSRDGFSAETQGGSPGHLNCKVKRDRRWSWASGVGRRRTRAEGKGRARELQKLATEELKTLKMVSNPFW